MNWKAFGLGCAYAALSGIVGYAGTNISGVTGLDPVYAGLISAAIGAIGHALPASTSLAAITTKVLSTSAQK